MRGTAPARAIARLLTLGAVLAGLFAMHGLAAQACPGGTGMSAPVMTAPATAHPGGITPMRGPKAAALPSADADMPGHGTVCVFTPAPRGISALLALLLLAATVPLVSPAWPVVGVRSPISHRAPPHGGAELLTTLCVSRT
jgi:hypothetical protein